jgi:hypothetical protein
MVGACALSIDRAAGGKILTLAMWAAGAIPLPIIQQPSVN